MKGLVMTDLIQQPFKGHEVLPLNSTPLERAMADVDAQHILSMDIPIETLWNPWKCPEQFLPFLAWAMSVDIWDPDWPVAVKRRVIAVSPEVHEYKGTRYATEAALASIGISADITEWWETVPPKRRGTFSVITSVNETIYGGSYQVIDQRMVEMAYQAVKASKPKSRVFTMGFTAETQSTLGMGVAMSPALEILEFTACIIPEIEASSKIGMGVAMSPSLELLEIEMDTTL